jgi:A/G-specific adenine glycosylase
MRAAMLAWYDTEGRTLAFRETRDPYAILVSEAMAQQTQAPRAAEAWRGFLAAFPTFAALAAASPATVLRAWRGLGYNRRALALRQTAIRVMAEHGGQLPRDVAQLERLPGIGPYTARAVAALAFGLPVGAVDTNVRRVLGRSVAAGASLSARELQAIADGAVPVDRPGHWTHALMDVGAVFCRPRQPRCEACPAATWCQTAANPTALSGPTAAGASGPAARRSREAAAPFVASSRWLRGRILDRLRDAADGAWVELGDEIGRHDRMAIDVALAALQREGLVELVASEPPRARLPLA